MLARTAMIEALLPKAQSDAWALFHVARLMREDGQDERAVTMCREVLAFERLDPELEHRAKRFLGERLPGWHVAMLNDSIRNQAYDAALRRAVKPGMRVLEIGTGSGLLAMMAARAGAAEVVTCEVNPILAQTAREIIAANGYADRIRVITGHSTRLTAEDIGGRADLLVSEIISNDVLCEQVLPAHEHARRELLKPEAPVIPARGAYVIALAEDRDAANHEIGVVEGFDLSELNRMMPVEWPIHPSATSRLTLRSEAHDLFTFDFSGSEAAHRQTSLSLASTGGRVNGAVNWLRLELDDEVRYENRPGEGARFCWPPIFHPFGRAIDTQPGDEIGIRGTHDVASVTFWPE